MRFDLSPAVFELCRFRTTFTNVYTFAYYYIDLMIGLDNVQRTSVIMDTGSSVLAFPCQGCRDCGKSHLDTPLDHRKYIYYSFTSQTKR